uniref:Serpin domain-containing protein n=1 Tax=Panagrolaimus davidi TaxID=227884 RepID=A0A914Q6N9_9BILA
MNSLAIIFAGSEGSTADQIHKIIGEEKSRNAVIEKFDSLIYYCNGLKDSLLGHAYYKSLFISYEEFNTSVVEVMNKLSTEFKQFNVHSDIVKEINNFISRNTNNQISNSDIIISKEETSITILDAIYIDHIWDNPFTSDSTFLFFEPPFSPYSARKAPCIFRLIENEEWNFTEGENWKCLGIPYKGRKTWLHILLPNEYSGLNQLKFDIQMLKECISKKVTPKMEVTIPVFEIEKKINLNQTLNKFGITNIFNHHESISNMLNHPSHIDNYFHLMKININQTGLKKPFYTSLTLEERIKLAEEQGYESPHDFEGWVQSEREEEIESFDADHPFYYFVTLVNDSVEDLKSIIAMGKYV